MEIVLPLYFDFDLVDKKTGYNIETHPKAGIQWKNPNTEHPGLKFWIDESIPLPRNWGYTVGPDVRHIVWDSKLYESSLPLKLWKSSGWEAKEIQISSLDEVGPK